MRAESSVTEIPTEISVLFPSATRIGERDSNIPITPVFQLNQLLGYAFETDDLTDYVGFSGDSINLLIGLDPKGVFTGLTILKHHEPIFLHGLGEKPMRDFIQQYRHHSVKEQYIIGAENKTSNNVTYFDGVTRATVSILVIHDTIISSALKVAREKLQGFSKAVPYAIDQSYFERLNFQQLIDKGYLTHWQVSHEQLTYLPSEIREHIQTQYQSDAAFIDLFTAFISIPIVGKNLLGDKEFERLQRNLQPNEHALMLLNRGQFSFVGDDFVPQSVSDRLHAEQDELPVELRDIDFYSFYDPHFATTVPEYNDLNVFRIKSQTGFELQRKFTISLSMLLEENHLSQKRVPFETAINLPQHLFVKQETKATPTTPLWMTMWQKRFTEIIALVLYLVCITTLFIHQKHITRDQNKTHNVRFLCLLLTLFFVGFYSQGQLSVTNIYTLLLSLYNGFKIEVFLLDPIIFILWLYVFLSLFLFGRGLFCGWLCPFGALQELTGYIAQKLRIRQWRVPHTTHFYARQIKYLILIGLILTSFYSLTLAEQLAEVEPFKTSITLNFIRHWPFALYAILLLALGLKVHKFYCRYICPLGAGLAILGRYPILKWLDRRRECGSPCQLCRTKKCAIDAINQDGSINYSECVQCLECLVTIQNPRLCVIDKYQQKQKGRPLQKRISITGVVEP
ncbi:4Fe-4S binding protein [Vibrio panuliri]|uniref:4Fe-4S binding protein n=1 Tax=Vibrio panuliri TaxID=1381081 RepID=UPI000AC6B566|nr:4Fe-4S binding protein [Vibrio panuliri]